MPLSPPVPAITEPDSVSKDFICKGEVLTVTVSARFAHVFDDGFNISFGLGRPKIKAKGRTEIIRPLHRYIYGPIADNMVIDHIDRNPLNNVCSNLREVSYRFNSVNSNTRRPRQSKYKGVQKRRSGNYESMWFGKSIGTFRTERLAKVSRILAARKEGPLYAELESENETTREEEEEVEEVLLAKKTIRKAGEGSIFWNVGVKRWQAAIMINGVDFKKTFKTKAEAVQWLDGVKEEERKRKEEEERNIVIPRTAQGHAYLTATNGKKVLVDDDIYKKMYKNKISIDKTGYARFKGWPVHNTVNEIPYNTRKECIDHRNRNRLDNRRVNLRIVSRQFNSRNVENPGASGVPGVQKAQQKDGTPCWKVKVLEIKTGKKHYKNFKYEDLEGAIKYRHELHRRVNPEEYI